MNLHSMKNALMYFLFVAVALLSSALINTHALSSTSPLPTPSPTPPPVLKKSDTENSNKAPQAGTTTNDDPEEIGEEGTLRVNTALVTVPVSVMDRDGRYVFDLRREEFRLYEDGTEQDVAFFASIEKPFTVVLMLDVSDSAVFRIDEVKDAAIAFVDQLRANDSAIVVAFARQVEMLASSNTDKEVLRNAIRNVSLGTGTSLYNAVDMTLKQILQNVPGRKAIVLFTDGVDTTSLGATFESNLRDAAESEPLIYTVQYDLSKSGKPYITNGRTQVVGAVGRARRAIANKYLGLLPERTGGRQFHAKSVEGLRKSFADIAAELRHQYSLGFYPQSADSQDQPRRLKVQVTRRKLIVRSRVSYGSGPPEMQ